MKKYLLIYLILILFVACKPPKENTEIVKEIGSDEEAISNGMERKFVPELTLKEKELLPKAYENYKLSMEKFKSTRAVCNIAFSYSGFNHFSGNQDELVFYNKKITAEGFDGLMIDRIFIAPCAGLYYFTISFVKNVQNGGTNDDVEIYLARNNTPPYNQTGWLTTKPITESNGNINNVAIGSAWAGENTGQRPAAVYSVILKLAQNEAIGTFIHSDTPNNQVSPNRRVAYFNFSGFRISD
ncbi:MAG: hypothetical protein IAE93_12580 [Ignavibacteria bacterium]|nr:hypothetical protein [Ignavibacteria bacterium]